MSPSAAPQPWPVLSDWSALRPVRGDPEGWTDAEHERNRCRQAGAPGGPGRPGADVDALAQGASNAAIFAGRPALRPGRALLLAARHLPVMTRRRRAGPLYCQDPMVLSARHRLKRNRDPLLKSVIKAALVEAYRHTLMHEDRRRGGQCIAGAIEAYHHG
eukprot:jgi/Mesvir1/11722/Mv25617-RA.1